MATQYRSLTISQDQNRMVMADEEAIKCEEACFFVTCEVTSQPWQELSFSTVYKWGRWGLNKAKGCQYIYKKSHSEC